MLKQNPIHDHVAAISCGIYAGEEICDIDYLEDSEAAADANFVLTGSGAIVEIQLDTFLDRELEEQEEPVF